MAINREGYNRINTALAGKNIMLVAVSKTKPVEDIMELYHLGHRDFGENYVKELADKAALLPKDIRWHFIGHLQTNKVKLIVPFVQLIHGVDSLKLLEEINKQAGKVNKTIECLLQVHIAQEETKFGLSEKELDELLAQLTGNPMKYIRLSGLMGMASFTDDMQKVRAEFRSLKMIFEKLRTRNTGFKVLSMGMSADYQVAVEEGSTLVRIGSLLFGERAGK